MKIEKSELLKFYLIWNSPFEKFQDWFQEYIDTDGLRTHKEIKEIHQDFDLLEKILTDIGEPPFPENDVVVLSADECLLCDENNILHPELIFMPDKEGYEIRLSLQINKQANVVETQKPIEKPIEKPVEEQPKKLAKPANGLDNIVGSNLDGEITLV